MRLTNEFKSIYSILSVRSQSRTIERQQGIVSNKSVKNKTRCKMQVDFSSLNIREVNIRKGNTNSTNFLENLSLGYGCTVR